MMKRFDDVLQKGMLDCILCKCVGRKNECMDRQREVYNRVRQDKIR